MTHTHNQLTFSHKLTAMCRSTKVYQLVQDDIYKAEWDKGLPQHLVHQSDSLLWSSTPHLRILLVHPPMKLPLVRQSITRKTKPIAKYIVNYRTTLEAKYIQLLRIEKEYLNSMPCMTHNYHLKFPLHLPNSELPGSQKTAKEIISHTVAAFPSLKR